MNKLNIIGIYCVFSVFFIASLEAIYATTSNTINSSNFEDAYSMIIQQRALNKSYEDTSPVPELKPKLIGGFSANPNSIKYLVSLQLSSFHYNYYGTGHFCAGILITTKVILTAAHCLIEKSGNKYKSEHEILVLSGIYNLYEPNAKTRETKLKTYLIHPFFTRNDTLYDIALLFLENDLPNFWKTHLPLADETPTEGTECIVTGWGKIFENGPYSGKAQYVNVTVANNEECLLILYRRPTVGTICAKSATENLQAPCNGDSGGPLICDGKIAGIVSWSYKCSSYVAYTDVPYYMDWIKSANLAVRREKSSSFIIALMTILLFVI